MSRRLSKIISVWLVVMLAAGLIWIPVSGADDKVRQLLPTDTAGTSGLVEFYPGANAQTTVGSDGKSFTYNLKKGYHNTPAAEMAGVENPTYYTWVFGKEILDEMPNLRLDIADDTSGKLWFYVMWRGGSPVYPLNNNTSVFAADYTGKNEFDLKELLGDPGTATLFHIVLQYESLNNAAYWGDLKINDFCLYSEKEETSSETSSAPAEPEPDIKNYLFPDPAAAQEGVLYVGPNMAYTRGTGNAFELNLKENFKDLGPSAVILDNPSTAVWYFSPDVLKRTPYLYLDIAEDTSGVIVLQVSWKGGETRAINLFNKSEEIAAEHVGLNKFNLKELLYDSGQNPSDEFRISLGYKSYYDGRFWDNFKVNSFMLAGFSSEIESETEEESSSQSTSGNASSKSGTSSRTETPDTGMPGMVFPVMLFGVFTAGVALSVRKKK